jgi:hypothetical protein
VFYETANFRHYYDLVSYLMKLIIDWIDEIDFYLIEFVFYSGREHGEFLFFRRRRQWRRTWST